MRRWALVATQLTLVAYLMLKRAWGAAGLTLLLPLATRYFQTYVFAGFEKSCNAASVESALGHDHELREPAGAAPAARRKRLSVLLSGGPRRRAGPAAGGRNAERPSRRPSTRSSTASPSSTTSRPCPTSRDVEVGVGAGPGRRGRTRTRTGGDADARPAAKDGAAPDDAAAPLWGQARGQAEPVLYGGTDDAEPDDVAYVPPPAPRVVPAPPEAPEPPAEPEAPTEPPGDGGHAEFDFPGGGLFFRVITAPNTSSYNAVGFIPASDGAGLAYPRATVDHLLDDAGSVNLARGPAGWSDDESFFTYQLATDSYPGRHTFLSRTTTPDDAGSWRRVAGEPMFLGLKSAGGSPFLEAAALATCDGAQTWTLGTDGRIAGADGYCLSLSGSRRVADRRRVACGAASAWTFGAATKQLRVKARISASTSTTAWGRRRSASGTNCVAVEETLANDCGTAVFFPDASSSKAYAVATFGELSGANLSLVSSGRPGVVDLERPLLETRPDSWDDATLSAGPAPSGSPTAAGCCCTTWTSSGRRDPARCRGSAAALGWAILDGDDFSVLARARPLVYAALPWELAGFTDRVVYSDGVRPEGSGAHGARRRRRRRRQAFRIEVAV
ncbi:hypothetical protein JL721_11325 [Aureococcus anophagefferens]|nr:hypothetical protein JL721_11325 [Aureococcus anophagefferens]